MDEKQLAKRQKMLARIQEFTLMDDEFMTRFFDGDNECTQIVLRTILGRDDLREPLKTSVFRGNFENAML